MRNSLVFIFMILGFSILAQVTDDFSDGDFTNNPTWGGTTTDYVVNVSSQLQLNNTIASTSYLSIPHGLTTLDDKEWVFWTKQSFSPSGSNNGRVYLTANNSDLSSDPDGFYVQLGESGSGDAIRLFKVIGGVHTEILAGPSGQIASSFEVRIKVVRDNAANWELYADITGGQNYTLLGTVNDATVLLGTHFGFLDNYTVSNATKFYHDDVYIGNIVVDLTPPVLLSATPVSATQIDVLFDEAIDPATAQITSNYNLNPSISITGASVDVSNNALVHLTLGVNLTNGTLYDLTTNGIADLNGNLSSAQTVNFSYLVAETPAFGDIIITEFLCDPTPVVGLKEAEFVEIYNASTKIFDVQGWKIGDASSQGTLQQMWLMPGDYLILTSTSNVDSFTVNNKVGVTSFPSLNNSGDDIVLKSDLGLTLDSISYTDSWYKDPSKEDGGYSIERINLNHPCSDENNWKASEDNNGGTPGLQNSVYDLTPDNQAPEITSLLAQTPNFLEVHFNEGMDSLSLVNASVSITPVLTEQNRYILKKHPKKMTLEFAENLTPSQTYQFEIQNVKDCWQNTASVLSGKFALPEIPAKGDLVINEILFDPVTGGSDWVEIYNNSDKLINLNGLELANLSNDTISNNKIINVDFLLFPKELAVVSEDTLQVIQYYPAHQLGRFIEMDLPSYPNDEGTVFLIHQNEVLDEVSYSDDWHFPLLDDKDGKSLERIDPKGGSNDPNNWHTAAESIGFGTPGQPNSQYSPASVLGDFEYIDDVFSPDSDGFQDVLQVSYRLPEGGMMLSFTVYDSQGRLVRRVLRSELVGPEGIFIWDGVRDDGTKASIGAYIGLLEAIGVTSGTHIVRKKVFTLAGRK